MMVMARRSLEDALLTDKREELFMTGFEYNPLQKTVTITLTSLSGRQQRVATFHNADDVHEETLEDFDGSMEWTIIGFDADPIAEQRWRIGLQCLEKGLFFTSDWPTVAIFTSASHS
jgi:hypothetical protein